jgi:hypothetical protein
MKFVFAAALNILLAAMVWPELGLYRAEWLLADANARLSDALRGAITGDAALRSTETAFLQSRQAAAMLPDDPRTALASSVALLMLRRGAEAEAILGVAIEQGERPELTLNLGRARGIRGDEPGANAAFLRTAWASPAAIATLPSVLRVPLLERVSELETELRAGRMQAPPSLNAAH